MLSDNMLSDNMLSDNSVITTQPDNTIQARQTMEGCLNECFEHRCMNGGEMVKDCADGCYPNSCANFVVFGATAFLVTSSVTQGLVAGGLGAAGSGIVSGLGKLCFKHAKLCPTLNTMPVVHPSTSMLVSQSQNVNDVETGMTHDNGRQSQQSVRAL